MRANDIAEYELNVGAIAVQVVEVRIERRCGTERWGVGVGRGGRLLDYFEYARQRDEVIATYFPITTTSPLLKSLPERIFHAVMTHLRGIARDRYAVEQSENV